MDMRRKREILIELYEGIDTPYGIVALQKVLSSKFIGITQRDLREFLYTHESWQLKYPTVVGAPDKSYLLAKKPGFLELDYMFMPDESRGVNNNRNYLLTCIDRFSRYGWVIPRSNKTGMGTLEAFKRITTQFKKLTGSYPRIVFHDNGTELHNQWMKEYIESVVAEGGMGARQLLTEPYRPAVVIERFNRTIREKLDRFQHMFKCQRYVDAIPRIVKAYNNHAHKSTGEAPADLLVDKTLWRAVIQKQKTAGEKRVNKTTNKLVVGDTVRLSLRKAKGSIGHVGSADQWSKMIYTIKRIVKSRGAHRYKLTDSRQKDFAKLVYADRLQKVLPVLRKVGYKDKPRLSKVDPELKSRQGLFGSIAPKPIVKPKRKYVKKKVLPPQRNKLGAYFGK